MLHTGRDAAVLLGELLLYLGAGVGIVYALGVSIALLYNVFRSRLGLYISFALSMLASIPLLMALTLQWPYLPATWDTNPPTAYLSLFDGLMLCFVWTAPALQYNRQQRTIAGAVESRSTE